MSGMEKKKVTTHKFSDKISSYLRERILEHDLVLLQRPAVTDLSRPISNWWLRSNHLKIGQNNLNRLITCLRLRSPTA